MNEVWAKLAAPFPFEDIKIMPQTLTKQGDKAKATAYFDARAVMNRLDEVVGAANWRAEYREMHLGAVTGVLCRLTVTVDGKEIVREDGSDPSDIEGFKGAISGALKRAFSALGNRTLYETDLGWQPIETYENGQGKKQFKKWTDAALADMRRAYERQVGMIAKPSGPTKVTTSNGAVVTEPAKPPVGIEGKNAFGYVPVRWPLPKMFSDPMSDAQAKMMTSKARERTLPEEDLPTIRRLVLEAYGVEDDASKAAASLFIDWLINAEEEALDKSVAAAEAAHQDEPLDLE